MSRLLRPRTRTSVRLRPLFAALLAVFGVVVPAGSASAFGSMDVTMAIISATPTTGMAPLVVAFDGSQSYCVESCSLVGYQWDFGDGTGATGVTAAHTYTRGGTYAARLTVTADNATTNTAMVDIRVGDMTRAVVNASMTAAQIPFTSTFDGSGSTVGWDKTIVSYQWSFGDGATATGAVVSHAFTTAGVRQVALTVTDTTGYAQTSGVTVFAQDALVAAANVAASSPTKGTVSLAWTNRTILLQRNWIERCQGSSCTGFATIFGALGTDTRFADASLKSGTTYSYRIRSLDYLGRTVTSAIVKVKVR